MRKRDGGVVDAELLRPRAWIEASGIAVGKPLPLNLPELNIRVEVSVTAIEDCPPIASGAGSVVTARFVTREAHLVASVQLRGPGGELATLTGTELHPIWSADRADWIPLSQLQPGERLLCSNATTSWGGESERGQAHAIVLGVTLSTVCEPVYNLEIHGEHVYQVGELGVLVHNGNPADCPLESVNAPSSGLRNRGSRLGQKQGREFRSDQLQLHEFDANQPAHVRGWLENERRRIASGNGSGSPRNPPGYVLGHGRTTPAREGFDYSNSSLQLSQLNELEEIVRRRRRRLGAP